MHKFISNIPMIVNDISTLQDVTAQNMDLSGSLDVSENVTIGNTLNVTGVTSLSNDLNVTGVTTLSNDLNVTGNLVVDGSFNFNEVIQNITTVNNELLISTQLDISNQGTGPALKVSQYGLGIDKDVALFDAGNEGQALKIDSVGDSHFYKDVNIDGNLTVSGVSNSFIPRGGIIMWSGVIIPESWSLCDGTNGTPDLRNRFIVSSGSSYNIGTSGGSTTRTLSVSNLPSHNHTGTTNNDGAHHHSQRHGSIDDKNFTSGNNQRPPGDSGTVRTTTYTIDNTNSSHQHAFTTNSTGSGTSFDIRPPYYALAFIMKL